MTKAIESTTAFAAMGRSTPTRGRCAYVKAVTAVVLCAVVLAAFASFAGVAGAATRVTVAAVGDVLIHDAIIDSVRGSNGVYNFDLVFTYIAPYLADADYTVANLETKFAGSGPGYSGYPRFNCPESLAGTLKRAGVDMLATANNHTMDMGWDGIVNTLNYSDAAGLAHIGTARSQAERDAPVMKSVNGVKIGFVNYTESTNGIALPSGRPYAANVRTNTEDLVAACIAEAKRARQAGADIVLAVLHFGNEYQRTQNSRQQGIAKRLLANGIDAVIGSHPHVVQPIVRESVSVGGQTVGRYSIYMLIPFTQAALSREYVTGSV